MNDTMRRLLQVKQEMSCARSDLQPSDRVLSNRSSDQPGVQARCFAEVGADNKKIRPSGSQ